MKLRRFEPVAGLGGVLLLVSLFLKWFGDASGWRAMRVIDVLLALIALLAISVPLVSLASDGPAKPVAVAVIASVLTPLAVLLVAFRLLDNPGPVEAGAWLAFAAALLAFAGSWLSMRDESTPGAVPPDVPRRPAPPAQAA